MTAKRFVVNAGCGMGFAPEVVRFLYAHYTLGDPGWSAFLAGGAFIGIFGVVFLDVIPALLNVLVPKWLGIQKSNETPKLGEDANDNPPTP